MLVISKNWQMHEIILLFYKKLKWEREWVHQHLVLIEILYECESKSLEVMLFTALGRSYVFAKQRILQLCLLVYAIEKL